MSWRLWGMIVLVTATTLVLTFSRGEQRVTNEPPVATSTLAVVPTKKPAEVALPTKPTPKTATTAATPEVVAVAIAPKATPVAKKTPVAPEAPKPPQPTQSEFDTTSAMLRGAIVNILCLSNKREIHSTSGSGVIIDPRGIILTNAHIAQYFLYTGDPSLAVSCTIRTGSPARSAYRANLIFIPPSWVTKNAQILSIDNPTGNGEHDYAFLGITESTSHNPLPTTIPFIPLSQSDIYVDEPVVIGTYAAQFLSTSEIQSSLYPTVVFGQIKAIYTFLESTVDVLTLGGSAAAQEGSSGGGVSRAPGVIEGIITTSTTEGETSTRTLGGITTSYIRRSYEKETGTSLETLFGKSPAEAAHEFAPQISGLRAILVANIPH